MFRSSTLVFVTVMTLAGCASTPSRPPGPAPEYEEPPAAGTDAGSAPINPVDAAVALK